MKGSVAVAQQHAYRIATVIGDRQVRFAIAVEISGHNGLRIRSGGEGLRRREGPVAVSQQYAHRIVVIIGHGDIHLAIAVEIARRDGNGPQPRPKIADRRQSHQNSAFESLDHGLTARPGPFFGTLGGNSVHVTSEPGKRHHGIRLDNGWLE